VSATRIWRSSDFLAEAEGAPSDLRLRDQAVRDQQIVRTLDPADEKTSVAEVEGGRKFEEVRRRFSSSHPLFPSFTWRTQI
jgi:hypothetical protein